MFGDCTYKEEEIECTAGNYFKWKKRNSFIRLKFRTNFDKIWDWYFSWNKVHSHFLLIFMWDHVEKIISFLFVLSLGYWLKVYWCTYIPSYQLYPFSDPLQYSAYTKIKKTLVVFILLCHKLTRVGMNSELSFF